MRVDIVDSCNLSSHGEIHLKGWPRELPRHHKNVGRLSVALYRNVLRTGSSVR